MHLTQQQQKDYEHLTRLATELAEACPDMRQMARKTAQGLLEKHQLGALEPDQVYFHRFHNASSSSRTFNGWQHHAPPYQSLTLPQLVMRRFDPAEQDNYDQLETYTGFYSEGPGKEAYDESNEVRLLAKDALDYFWQVDFSSQFRLRLDTFWSEHRDAYRTLTKAHFLSAVLHVQTLGNDSPLAKRALRVAQALAGRFTWPPSLEQLQQEVIPPKGFKIGTFDIGGYIASDVLRVVMDDGYQLLYLPGEGEVLKLFANERELYAWVLASTRTPRDRARFLSHFPLSSATPHEPNVGLDHLLDVMRSQWDAHHPSGLNTLDYSLPTDAFSQLRDSAQQRMLSDVRSCLHSNADLRKQLWIGYLGAFNRVFGPLAALDWPLALAAVGAGLAETGLDIDQAINGHTTVERKAGVTAAILAGINTLFNVALLASFKLGGNAEPAYPAPVEPEIHTYEPEPATPSEIQQWVPESFQPEAFASQVEKLQSNVILPDVTGHGVHSLNGKQYVMVNDLVYQVRYAREINTWLVVDPEAPYSFTRTVPIFQDAEGNWQFIARLGLKGGGLPRPLLRAWGRLRPRPAVAPLEPTRYEVPEAQRQALKRAALDGQGEWALRDPDSGPPYSTYQQLRDQLATDAAQFYARFEQPPRPLIPRMRPAASSPEIIRSLYENCQGLVVGESHTEQSAKQFLIANMQHLKNQGVKVLYLEHFMTDFQQVELDVFNRTGALPDELKSYIQERDARSSLGPTPYTLKKVLYEAYSRNIRIQAIDCMASYRLFWEEEPFPASRQRMMNYFAHVIIEADQARRGPAKWLALVGNTHVNTFDGVPGLSELEGTIGLRVQDVDLDQPRTIGPDTGLEDSFEGDRHSVRCDLLLETPLPHPWM